MNTDSRARQGARYGPMRLRVYGDVDSVLGAEFKRGDAAV
jgi:hypothetical protein